MKLDKTNTVMGKLAFAEAVLFKIHSDIHKKSKVKGILLGMPVSVMAVGLGVGGFFGGVAESIIKGSVNSVAAPFSKKASILKGLTQLGGGLISIGAVPFLPLIGGIAGVALPIAIIASQKSTEKLSNFCIFMIDPGLYMDV